MKPWMRTLLWIAAVLGAVFGVLRYFFLDFHRVPNEPLDARNWANSPNLEPGDLVLVWRGGTPHIGDVVRCPDPTDPTRWLVARVIGTGGDKIEVVDGIMRINGFRISTASCHGAPRKVMDASGAQTDMNCYSEEVGGSKHDVAVLPTGIPPFAEARVEAGKLFLLSDNRSAPWSHDSRTPEVSQIEADRCTHRLVVRLVSAKGWSDSERRMGFLF